jgi:hypothetical protein
MRVGEMLLDFRNRMLGQILGDFRNDATRHIGMESALQLSKCASGATTTIVFMSSAGQVPLLQMPCAMIFILPG